MDSFLFIPPERCRARVSACDDRPIFESQLRRRRGGGGGGGRGGGGAKKEEEEEQDKEGE